MQEQRLFDGVTIDPELDDGRLTTKVGKTYQAMRGGGGWKLSELAERIESTEAGASARIRDLRKPRWGGHVIEATRLPSNLWLYRMTSDYPLLSGRTYGNPRKEARDRIEAFLEVFEDEIIAYWGGQALFTQDLERVLR